MVRGGKRATRGGTSECHAEARESAKWRQERVPRGGRRECHVEAGLGEGGQFVVGIQLAQRVGGNECHVEPRWRGRYSMRFSGEL